MISRSGSQRTGSATNRPYSSNNPFRTAANDSSVAQYSSDLQFQDWVRANGVQSPYAHNSRANSSSSVAESIEEHQEELEQSPRPARPVAEKSMSPSSNNPFLDDVSSSSGDSGQPPVYPVKGSRSQVTAKEEKDRLRDRYKEEDNLTGDLPPSYDEVAGSRKAKSSYPREKEGSSARRSHSHRQHRHKEEGKRESDRERTHRHRSSSSKEQKKKGKPGVTPKNVDTIDKMDVTGLFGGSFHHDGPFDACTPHRNKNSKAAPVMAFPADGPNNSIGGASAKKSTLNEVFGREEIDDDDELYKSRAPTRGVTAGSNGSTSTLDAIKPNAKTVTQFDVKGRSHAVHGPTTEGLGSTTFLDGAPASKIAIRDDIKQHVHQTRTGGVQRKKSLTQRLQVNGGPNAASTEPLTLAKTHSGHLENGDDEDEDAYLGVRFDEGSRKSSTGNKLLRRVKSLKVGRKP